jgi:alcohol dehydrogenase class IV
LPKVLKVYGKSAYKKLAILAELIGCESSLDTASKANWFIAQIEQLNKDLNITNTFGDLIQDKDLDFLTNHAYKESIPLYPTPRLLSKEELKEIYLELKNK